VPDAQCFVVERRSEGIEEIHHHLGNAALGWLDGGGTRSASIGGITALTPAARSHPKNGTGTKPSLFGPFLGYVTLNSVKVWLLEVLTRLADRGAGAYRSNQMSWLAREGELGRRFP
jgi:hypothetical protein